MTAEVLDLHPGKVAWTIAETRGTVTETIACQALIYAAERVAADRDWMTDQRWVTVIMRLMHAAIPAADRRRRFAALVVAVPFGPQVQAALERCVRP